jgi:anti-anti-sigma factor
MLKITAKNLETVTIVTLQGEIVTAQTEILEGVVQSLSETSAVILDLARVSRIDAHGLGVLLTLREQAQTRGIRFELMNVSKFLTGVLEMTHLDSVFQITSGVEFFPAVAAERRPSVAPLRSCA